MSVRITLSGAEIGEVWAAMESQRDYYDNEIARLTQDAKLPPSEQNGSTQQRLAEVVVWRDACVSVLAKMRRGSRRQAASQTDSKES